MFQYQCIKEHEYFVTNNLPLILKNEESMTDVEFQRYDLEKSSGEYNHVGK